MANFNMITDQKQRKPLWTGAEMLTILDAVEAGDLTALECHLDRIKTFINDRHEQLKNEFKITETAPIPMFAATVAFVNRDFWNLRGYIEHVKRAEEKGMPYINPYKWCEGIEITV